MDREKSFIGKIADRAKRIAHIATKAAHYAMEAEDPKGRSAGGRRKLSDFKSRAVSGTPRGALHAPARTPNSERRRRDAEAPIYR
jgi:hypothetical protein